MTQLAVQDMLQTKFNLIAYKGAPQMITDMLSGQIDAVIDLTGGYLAQIKAGKLRALAIIGNKRIPQLPDVPTMRELGLDFTAEPWYALEGPKGIPADIVRQMNQAAVEVLKDPATGQKLAGAGITPSTSTPEELEKLGSTPKSRSGARSSRSTTSRQSEASPNGRRRHRSTRTVPLQTSSTTFPTAPASTARCACPISASGKRAATVGRNAPCSSRPSIDSTASRVRSEGNT